MSAPPEASRLEELANALARVEGLLQARDTAAEVQKRAFDQLYQELVQYKEDFAFQAEKPLLLDLLLFYDSLSWFQRSLVREDVSPEVIADSFQYLVDEFLEILYRRDIAPVEARKQFDPAIHKAVKVVGTQEAERDETVDQVLKRGFTRGQRLLRPEEVVVRRLGHRDDP